MKVILKWSEHHQQWLMLKGSNCKFIMHFFDCENMNFAFPELDKTKSSIYDVSIKKEVGE